MKRIKTKAQILKDNGLDIRIMDQSELKSISFAMEEYASQFQTKTLSDEEIEAHWRSFFGDTQEKTLAVNASKWMRDHYENKE